MSSKLDSESLPTKVQELAYRYKVRDAMTKDTITVRPTDTMGRVREILQDAHISGLPVIEDGNLKGIMSIDNFISCIINGGRQLDDAVDGYMTGKVETLYADDPLIHAIGKFEQYGYGRFPVLERGKSKLVGILTKGDIIKCLLQKLEVDYLEEEIPRYRASHIFQDIHSHKTSLTLRYNVRGGDFNSAGEQSGFLKVNLIRLGIPPRITRRITVACCEAEMNIIIFGGGGQLVAWVGEDKVTVNAIDKGPGIPDIEKAMTPGYSTAPDWVREMGFGAGMGLPNIKNCTDEMHVQSEPGKGTKLEFTVFMDQNQKNKKDKT
jgi:CBS domain-containing protein/anti-sigma regulatory factor (Ser/Thr protein kinase)